MFSINDYWSFQVHGGGGHEGGIVEGLNNLLEVIDGLSGHSAGEIFSLLLPGIAGMANFHPLVVHFPIALLTMFFLVELARTCLKKESWQMLASGLLYTGTFFAAISVYLGFQAAETVAHDDVAHGIMEQHESYGVAVLCLAGLLSIWRLIAMRYKGIQIRSVFLMLAGLLNILLVLGADLGGLMVYGHGVGVQVGPGSPGLAEGLVAPHEHDHEHEHGGHDH